MKVGMNLMLWTTEPHFNEYGAQLDRLAELGYDAVEIPVYDLSAEDIERYAKRAAELKMEAQAIDVFTADIGDMIGHDPALRRAAVLRRSCRLPHAGAQSGRIRIHAVTLSRSGTDAPRTELPQGSG